MAQWLACWAHNPKVRGSKPRCAIMCACVVYMRLRHLTFVCAELPWCALTVPGGCKLRQERIELPTLGL